MATTLLVVLAVGVGLGMRSADALDADPPGAVARLVHLASAAGAADVALEQLEIVLDEAIDHARHGTALTVSGDAPAVELNAAADVAAAGVESADAARRRLLALAGMGSAVLPGMGVPAISFDGTELRLVDAQLRASAVAATVFVERRHATEAVVNALAGALRALEDDDPRAALVSLAAADAPLALLEEWQERPPLLRYWMMVSADLLEAARAIAAATIDGDALAVEAAAKRYAEAAEAALGADNALAFTLSEAGAAVSATPLQRLARAAGEVVDLRAALQPLLQQPS